MKFLLPAAFTTYTLICYHNSQSRGLFKESGLRSSPGGKWVRGPCLALSSVLPFHLPPPFRLAQSKQDRNQEEEALPASVWVVGLVTHLPFVEWSYLVDVCIFLHPPSGVGICKGVRGMPGSPPGQPSRSSSSADRSHLPSCFVSFTYFLFLHYGSVQFFMELTKSCSPNS